MNEVVLELKIKNTRILCLVFIVSLKPEVNPTRFNTSTKSKKNILQSNVHTTAALGAIEYCSFIQIQAPMKTISLHLFFTRKKNKIKKKKKKQMTGKSEPGCSKHR